MEEKGEGGGGGGGLGYGRRKLPKHNGRLRLEGDYRIVVGRWFRRDPLQAGTKIDEVGGGRRGGGQRGGGV